MPKLTPLQWTVVAVFQLFYGFAVFALTRDYYQRHPGGAAPAAPRATASAPVVRVPPDIAGGSAIPESVMQKDPRLLAQMGDERFHQRRFDEAIRIYRKVLELDPADVDTYNDLGLALHYNGDSEEALRVLKQGVEKGPKFQRIWLTLGFVQMHTAERGEAVYTLRQALDLGPNNPVGQEARRLLDKFENSTGAGPD